MTARNGREIPLEEVAKEVDRQMRERARNEHRPHATGRRRKTVRVTITPADPTPRTVRYSIVTADDLPRPRTVRYTRVT